MLLQLGWTIALSMVVSLLLGLWLDNTFGTKPLGVLFFSLLGIIIGSIAVYRMVARAIEEESAKQPPKKYHKVDYRDEDDSDTKEDE